MDRQPEEVRVLAPEVAIGVAVRVSGLEVTLGLWVVVIHLDPVRDRDRDTVTQGVEVGVDVAELHTVKEGGGKNVTVLRAEPERVTERLWEMDTVPEVEKVEDRVGLEKVEDTEGEFKGVKETL